MASTRIATYAPSTERFVPIADADYEICVSETLGRHLIAKRDLPEGHVLYEAPAHVLALRIYTSNSSPRINEPLRKGIKPHPFAATTYFIYDALKRLRKPGRRMYKDNMNRGISNTKHYFRGLSNVEVDESLDQGCELGCLSTSVSRDEAKSQRRGPRP